MPRVSIIMTVRNGERYLSDALSSLLSQSFSDIEIIVTNNGSTDSTAEILASVNDPRLKIISVDPFLNSTFASGILKAFNAAIGEFVAVQDSDDFSENSRIEKQVHFLETHPSVGLVGCNFELINEYDEHLFYTKASASSNKLMQQYAVGNQLAHSTIMFRRKIAVESGGYDTEFEHACDYKMALDILYAGHKISVIAESLVKIHRHPDQETALPSTAMIRSLNLLNLLQYAQELSFLTKSWRLKGRNQITKAKFQIVLNLFHNGQKLDAFKYFGKIALETPFYLSLYTIVRTLRGQLGDAPQSPENGPTQ
jgi:glycosyltransferase involved in cell wall biosynthesis